jgi:hypothetical protein
VWTLMAEASVLAFIFVSSCALLISSMALAQADKELSPNTINCAAFRKTANGNWYVGARTTFRRWVAQVSQPFELSRDSE